MLAAWSSSLIWAAVSRMSSSMTALLAAGPAVAGAELEGARVIGEPGFGDHRPVLVAENDPLSVAEAAVVERALRAGQVPGQPRGRLLHRHGQAGGAHRTQPRDQGDALMFRGAAQVGLAGPFLAAVLTPAAHRLRLRPAENLRRDAGHVEQPEPGGGAGGVLLPPAADPVPVHLEVI